MADFAAQALVSGSELASIRSTPEPHPAAARILEPAAPVDVVAPVISNFAPSVGTPLNRSDFVSFDVTDDTGLLRGEVFVRLGDDVFVVHDGEKFRGRFTNFSSRAAITGGFRYTVKPNGGWTQAPIFEVHAVDTSGNEAT